MRPLSTMSCMVTLFCVASLTFAQAPSPPTLVTALASFYYVPDIRLTWRNSDNSISSISYRVYRSASDTLHYELLATTYYPGYADFQLLSGTTYYYYITALVRQDTTVFESGRSSVVSATAGGPGGGGGGGGKRHNTGTIAGRVLDSISLKPVVASQVSFYRVSSSGLPVQKVLTDGSGHYKAALDTGWYLVRGLPPLGSGSPSTAYQGQWYTGASTPEGATPVHVVDTSRIVADFALMPPGEVTASLKIQGAVRDSAGAPVAGAMVAVMRTIQEMDAPSNSGDDVQGMGSESEDLGELGHGQGIVWRGLSDSLGNYQASVNPGGRYVVLAAAPGFAPQFFDHQAGPLTANILQPGGDTSGVDFALVPFGSGSVFTVQGSVRDSSGTRVPSRIVLIPLHHQAGPLSVRFSYTDSTGHFLVAHVRAGKYFVLALPFSRYAPAYFKAGAFGVRRWQAADTLGVAGDLSGVDIGVAPVPAGGLAHITGSTRSAGTPVGGVSVLAVADDGSVVGYGLSDDRGGYSVDGIPLGHVTVTSDLEGFQTAQTPITVAPGVLAYTGTDIALVPTVVTSVGASPSRVQGYALQQNYPNPFNPNTTIAFSLPATSTVVVKIYSVTGQEVSTLAVGTVGAGVHQVVWAGKDNAGLPAASGFYFYRFTASNPGGGQVFSSVRRMLLLK